MALSTGGAVIDWFIMPFDSIGGHCEKSYRRLNVYISNSTDQQLEKGIVERERIGENLKLPNL